ncbi:MAG: hypothetical protein CM15mP84_06380 [Cellvibrionales bacterium]|nr:MAG: hypothetical protein CM15mP84_06380 [Cellvibrionales bacterium]
MEGWEEDRVSGLIPRQPTVEVDTWRLITETADAHNEPGEFTALIGWEYSLIPGGANLHRIVLGTLMQRRRRPSRLLGLMTAPSPVISGLGLMKPVRRPGELYCDPHNSNISKGSMFDVRDIRGDDIDLDYAEIRRYWEPVVEITQIKGDSETHPALSPDDPFADFETYPYYIQREWTDYVRNEETNS